ncbi:MAG TPA: NTP transferase domain-containing protein [Candidatus Krumholzibacteria bacterium]|nr:NTP transferase domain-containing protein [Candidatus Krumholzibacteria bacterium]HPD71762.1 NTP transferase domain-containing protein [Candidatus Krumholzibacteria bacterium]HRY41305.1 NTP transferase domain-containing protein [Candidatus Krumholzibacteria bacterium]
MTGRTLVDAVVLAAGKGTRMKSDLPKVLHELAGRPLLAHVLATARAAGVERTVVVVGHQADRVRELCAAPDLVFVVQEPQLGTGHAVQVAAPALRDGGWTVILAGDVPLLTVATLRRLIDGTRASGAAATVLTCVVADAGAYGRIVKDARGNLVRIVEARDATPRELAIGEFNSGVYCFRTDCLREALAELTTDNDQGEYYLTDTLGWLVARGDAVSTVTTSDSAEVVGINTVAELAAAERLFAARQRG